MYNSFEIKTSPFSNPSHLQKLIYYPIWKFIGVIGVYTDGSITKSFRGLFDLTKKETLEGEILDNRTYFGTNLVSALNHAEMLLDAKFAGTIYDRGQHIEPSILNAMMLHPSKIIYPYSKLSQFDQDLSKYLKTHPDLNIFGF